MRTASGFTLVEMLAVIAIIALLVMMLAPTFSRTLQITEVTVCGSNLQKLSSGVNGYLSANQDHFPSSRDWIVPGGGRTWDQSGDHLRNGTLWPFVQSEGVYLCPTFATVCGASRAYRSYSMNYNLGSYPTCPPAWSRQDMVRLVAVDDPAGIMVLSDENPWQTDGINRAEINDGFLLSWSQADSIGTYHLPPGGDLDYGVSAVVFVDGHVEQRCAWDRGARESWYLTQNVP